VGKFRAIGQLLSHEQWRGLVSVKRRVSRTSVCQNAALLSGLAYLCASLIVLSSMIHSLSARPVTLKTRHYGAGVWVDGQMVGRAPLERLELSDGLHLVELRWGAVAFKRLAWVSPVSEVLEIKASRAELSAVEGLGEAAAEAALDPAEQRPEMSELSAGAELASDLNGLSLSQSWSLRHPMLSERLYLNSSGVSVNLLSRGREEGSSAALYIGAHRQLKPHALYVRRLNLSLKLGGAELTFGREQLSALLTVRPPLSSVLSPDELSHGEGSARHSGLYGELARLEAKGSAWRSSLELGRLATWSADSLRAQPQGDEGPALYEGSAALSWRQRGRAVAGAGLYALSAQAAEGSPQHRAALDQRWGAHLHFELKGPPESADHVKLRAQSAELGLLATRVEGAVELLGAELSGHAALMSSHPLLGAQAPWSLWPAGFEGDRAELALSLSHVRWIRVQVESQAGGAPRWLSERLSPQAAERTGLFFLSYLSEPLSFVSPAYTKLSGETSWGISLKGGALESALTTSLWASSAGAVAVTDPLAAAWTVSWRSMDLGLMKLRVERGPLGRWGGLVGLRLAFDELGVGLSCERPVSIDLIPVQGLISCGLNASLEADVRLTDP